MTTFSWNPIKLFSAYPLLFLKHFNLVTNFFFSFSMLFSFHGALSPQGKLITLSHLIVFCFWFHFCSVSSSTNYVGFIIINKSVAFWFQFRALGKGRKSSCGSCPRRRKTFVLSISSTNCIDFIIIKGSIALEFCALERDKRSTCSSCPKERKTFALSISSFSLQSSNKHHSSYFQFRILAFNFITSFDFIFMLSFSY